MITIPLGVQDLEAIAGEKGVGPKEMNFQLQDCVDVDALDKLSRNPKQGWVLQFNVPDYLVTVDREGGMAVDTIEMTASDTDEVGTCDIAQ